MKNSPVIVGIAQAGIAEKPDELITYALGSCVSVCLFDRKHYIAGMAHILLPNQNDAVDRRNPYKFADSGCSELLKAMLLRGAGREYLTAKLAGGARMFQTSGASEGIGARNVAAVREALRLLGIRIIAEDTGKDYGRTVILNSETGQVTVKSVKYGVNVI